MKKHKSLRLDDPARGRALRIHGAIAEDLGMRIVAGQYPPGHILDGEVQSSEQLNVSRTAYREAIRILAAKGLVNSRPKVGTRVSAQSEWRLLDPDVLLWIFRGEPAQEVLNALFELRSIVEPAAAALAATRRKTRHLDLMQDALKRMKSNALSTPQGRVADQDFHAALLAATENPFLVSLTKGVTAAVDALSEFKQREGPLKRDPVPDHERVYDAIAEKNAELASTRMTDLLRLAMMDTPVGRKPRLKKR